MYERVDTDGVSTRHSVTLTEEEVEEIFQRRVQDSERRKQIESTYVKKLAPEPVKRKAPPTTKTDPGERQAPILTESRLM